MPDVILFSRIILLALTTCTQIPVLSAQDNSKVTCCPGILSRGTFPETPYDYLTSRDTIDVISKKSRTVFLVSFFKWEDSTRIACQLNLNTVIPLKINAWRLRAEVEFTDGTFCKAQTYSPCNPMITKNNPVALFFEQGTPEFDKAKTGKIRSIILCTGKKTYHIEFNSSQSNILRESFSCAL
jgi:hypothetical protein